MAKYPRPFSLKWMDKESVDGIPKTVFVETDRPEVRKWNTQDRFCGNGWTRSQLMEYPGSFLWRRIDQEMEHSRSTKHNFRGMDDNLKIPKYLIEAILCNVSLT